MQLIEETQTKLQIMKTKTKKDWVVITYCDFGNSKVVFRKSYSLKSAKEYFNKIPSKTKYRIWQEDKKGKIINDTNIRKIKKNNKKYAVLTYCDYGEKNKKVIIRKSSTVQAAKNWFKEKSGGFTNYGTWKIWQEDKKGNVINER